MYVLTGLTHLFFCRRACRHGVRTSCDIPICILQCGAGVRRHDSNGDAVLSTYPEPSGAVCNEPRLRRSPRCPPRCAGTCDSQLVRHFRLRRRALQFLPGTNSLEISWLPAANVIVSDLCPSKLFDWPCTTFMNPTQTCVPTRNCQQDMALVDEVSSSVYIYQLTTTGSVNMLTFAPNSPVIKDADNIDGFVSSAAVWQSIGLNAPPPDSGTIPPKDCTSPPKVVGYYLGT
jgi:hypothetical protein